MFWLIEKTLTHRRNKGCDMCPMVFQSEKEFCKVLFCFKLQRPPVTVRMRVIVRPEIITDISSRYIKLWPTPRDRKATIRPLILINIVYNSSLSAQSEPPLQAMDYSISIGQTERERERIGNGWPRHIPIVRN